VKKRVGELKWDPGPREEAEKNHRTYEGKGKRLMNGHPGKGEDAVGPNSKEKE